MFKHELGNKVKTKSTGLEGILMSRSECLYGCNRYFIQPKVDKDMKLPEGWWADEDDIIIVNKGITAKKKYTGGLMSKNY
jgi:hypothetical protein